MLAGELGALHLVSAAEGLAGQAGKRFKAREPLLPGCGRVVRFFEGSAAGAEARIGAVGADGSARGAVAGGLLDVGVLVRTRCDVGFAER